MSTTVPPPDPDNTLLSIAAPTAFGQTLSYIIQGGQKRRIYDTQTLSLLATLYGQPKPITTAVAATIPSGPDFPSRADGTPYQGAPATYAYLLKGGLKSAVPDATTLRDSGHDPFTALAIAAADLAVDSAVAGAGVIYLFEEWLQPYIDRGELDPLLEPWWPSFTGPLLYYPGRRYLPSPLRAFVDFA